MKSQEKLEELEKLKKTKTLILSSRDQILEDISQTENLKRIKGMINELRTVLNKGTSPNNDNELLFESLLVAISYATEISINKKIERLENELFSDG